MTGQRILVTGASGFIGGVLCSQMLAHGLSVRGITRSIRKLPAGFENMNVGEIDDATNWQGALADCSVVVHLAARAHVMVETAKSPLTEFRRINTKGTLNLARQASRHGVRRFIFISSIGVNGAETFARPFFAGDLAAPHSPYAVSKHEAELALKALAVETGLEVVIIRPPLVYGPGAPGNFASMMRWLQRGMPLPLGAIHNRRSLVALDNLVDLIMTCLTHPAAANETFLVSDGQDVSTTELLRRMGQAMNRPARLIPLPAGLLTQAAALVGKGDMARRLCGSLQVDIEKTRTLLDWQPPLTLDQGLKKAAEGSAP